MTLMPWKKTEITTSSGVLPAVTPEVISASRSTDIPAFYSDWFMRRLEEGYSRWVNPFNRKSQFISFERMRAIVFWSKNPKPLMKHLEKLDQLGVAYYFQFTVNDYVADHGGALEPNVPPLESRIQTFQELSNRLGKHRVIWRFDPLILTEEINVERLLEKVKRVGDRLHPYTEKLVFSFVDIDRYAKVRNNLKAKGVKWLDFTPALMRETASGLVSLNQQWGLRLATCAEPLDLQELGIEPNKCIDDELLLRISNNDPALLKLFGVSDEVQTKLFDSPESTERTNKRPNLKDKGQRKECGCIISKDIGQYDTCPHLCSYCYANTSQKVVKKNMQSLQPGSDSILARSESKMLDEKKIKKSGR